MCVESGDVKVESADEWIKKSLSRMIHRYEPTDTFNMDVTVLSFFTDARQDFNTER